MPNYSKHIPSSHQIKLLHKSYQHEKVTNNTLKKKFNYWNNQTFLVLSLTHMSTEQYSYKDDILA